MTESLLLAINQPTIINQIPIKVVVFKGFAIDSAWNLWKSSQNLFRKSFPRFNWIKLSLLWENKLTAVPVASELEISSIKLHASLVIRIFSSKHPVIRKRRVNWSTSLPVKSTIFQLRDGWTNRRNYLFLYCIKTFTLDWQKSKQHVNDSKRRQDWN